MALHYLVQLPVSINNIVILSDPKSALTSILTGNSTRPDLVHEITWLTNTLTLNGSTVIFQWVPSHIGLRGNGMADKLANLALKQPHTHIKVKISYYELRSLVHRHSLEQFHTYKQDHLKNHPSTHSLALKPVLHLKIHPTSLGCLLRLRANAWRLKHRQHDCLC